MTPSGLRSLRQRNVASTHNLNRAARTLLAGGVVAYPTEAVYGLGCLPLEGAAVERLLDLKGRAAGKGLILIAESFDRLEPYVLLPDGSIRDEIFASWPGPVTWVIPARSFLPRWLTGGRETLAVRVTAHPVARYLAARTGSALVSTSANRSGSMPARSALRVRLAFADAIDDVVVGPLGDALRPTTIRDARTGATLRYG